MPKIKASSNEYTFINGFAVSPNLMYLIAEIDATKDESDGTRLLRLDQGDKIGGKVNIPFGTVAIDALGKQLTVIGVNGKIMNGGPGGFSVESVDPSTQGPEGKGSLRGCRRIGNHLYVMGMSRQVYQKSDDTGWRHIDQSLPPNSKNPITGFNAIDGYSESEIYAVGLNGEIFAYDGVSWTACESPTDVQLNGIRCTPEGIYACGADGTLLRGEKGRFSSIARSADTGNLYGIEWFKNRLYVASLKGMFVSENAGLKPVRVNSDSTLTACELHACPEMMISIGAKHLFKTEDGVSWSQIFV